jgi:hypothetical protein
VMSRPEFCGLGGILDSWRYSWRWLLEPPGSQ